MTVGQIGLDLLAVRIFNMAFSARKLLLGSLGDLKWNYSTMPLSAAWIDITYGLNKFFAISQYPISGYINRASSSDGINWVNESIFANSGINYSAIGIGNGRIIILGYNSIPPYEPIAYDSSDGVNFNISSFPNSSGYIPTSISESNFGAIALFSTDNKIYESSISGSSLIWSGPQSLLFSAVWLNVFSDSNNTIISGNGTTLLRRGFAGSFSAETIPNGAWIDAAYISNKNINVLVSNNSGGSSINAIWKNYNFSMDWQKSNLPFPCRSITYGDNRLMALSSSGQIAESFDGVSWIVKTPLTSLTSPAFWSKIKYGNGKFVAIANGSNIVAYTE